MAATFIGLGSNASQGLDIEPENPSSLDKLRKTYATPPTAPPPAAFQPPPAPPPRNPLDNYGPVQNQIAPPPPPPVGTAQGGPQPKVVAPGTPTPISNAFGREVTSPRDQYFTSGEWNGNTWQMATAASQYGLAEQLNPQLEAQETNLGTIATAAGDYARAQGDATQAQGAGLTARTGAISNELVNNQAGRQLAPVDVIAGDPAQQQAATLSRLRGYDAAPGTSAAERSVADQSNRDFANSLALARSGGTASQRAWGERAAVAQNFERQAQQGRTLATLRADEQERAKARELNALGAEAGVASGADTTRLNAGTAQAETDLALQDLQDRYTLGSQELGVNTLLQGQQLGLAADQQGFNQSLIGYQLPYQAQQDIIGQGNFQQQLGAQNFGTSQGLAIQAQQRQDAKNALPWQIGAGVAGGLGGGLIALSDERAKTSIQRLRDEDAAEAVEQSRGSVYKYKPGYGEDPDTLRAGPMAGDLKRTKFGKDLVRERPDGLDEVRIDRLALMNHAALGNALTRLRKLEGKAA